MTLALALSLALAGPPQGQQPVRPELPRLQVAVVVGQPRILVAEAPALEIEVRNPANRQLAVAFYGELQRWDAGRAEWCFAGHFGRTAVLDPGAAVLPVADCPSCVEPGRWRVRAGFGGMQIPWCLPGPRPPIRWFGRAAWQEFEVAAHAGNRGVVALLREGRLAEPRTAEDQLALLSLRPGGASARAAAQAELTATRAAIVRLVRREVDGRIAAGDVAEAGRIAELLTAAERGLPPVAGRWGGLRGELLEARYLLARIVDDPGRQELRAELERLYPARHATLDERWRRECPPGLSLPLSLS